MTKRTIDQRCEEIRAFTFTALDAIQDLDGLTAGRIASEVEELVRERLKGTKPTFTVTIAGEERHDGEKPYDYVVYADDSNLAEIAVLAEFSKEHDDPLVISVKPGLPNHKNWNDLR